jgi:hypothetical protein
VDFGGDEIAALKRERVRVRLICGWRSAFQLSPFPFEVASLMEKDEEEEDILKVILSDNTCILSYNQILTLRPE